jgi:hypothetical protein
MITLPYKAERFVRMAVSFLKDDNLLKDDDAFRPVLFLRQSNHALLRPFHVFEARVFECVTDCSVQGEGDAPCANRSDLPVAQKHSAARAEYVRVAALPMCWPLKSSSICLSIKGREGSAVRGWPALLLNFCSAAPH